MGPALRKKMSSNKIIRILILILTVLQINANFVKQISENEFELLIQEDGTNFTQKVRIDKENGFVINEVPAHNGRIETTFINDETNGLMLEVSNPQKAARITKSFMGEPVDEQKSIYEKLAQQEDPSDRIIVNHETSHPIELIDITGPAVDPKCVPTKYRKLIPKGYTIHLVHQVQKFVNQNIFPDKDNEQEFTVYDPASQENITIADRREVDEVFRHVFDDILPHIEGTDCPRSFMKGYPRNPRSKRQAVEEEPVTCYDEHFQRISGRCGRVIRGKCSVCNLPDMGYDCRGAGPKCFYTVKCSTLNHAKCLEHVMSQGASCQPCCHVRGCDGNEIRQDGSRVMDTCKHMPTTQDEVCPLAGKGCPIENVIEGYTDEKKKLTCWPHYEECTTLFDNDGTKRNTGMNCSPTRVKLRQKSFCCSGNQEGIFHNLPVC